LKELSYRVLCVDRERVTMHGLHGSTIPYGAEDYTGDRPLEERLDLISRAEFFMGLPSGLSWLAWGAGVPVVMIVGFTMPGTEFAPPTGCSSSTPATAAPTTSATSTTTTTSAPAPITGALTGSSNAPAASRRISSKTPSGTC